MSIKKEDARVYTNSSCIGCDKLEKLMVRVGALVLCNKCFEQYEEEQYPQLLDKYVKESQ